MPHSEWSPALAEMLKKHREQAGLSVSKLSRDNCISVSQLQQLEEGGESSFYTPAIKGQLGRRLLRQLGCDIPPPAPRLPRPPEPTVAPGPAPSARPWAGVRQRIPAGLGVRPALRLRPWGLALLAGLVLLALGWIGVGVRGNAATPALPHLLSLPGMRPTPQDTAAAPPMGPLPGASAAATPEPRNSTTAGPVPSEAQTEASAMLSAAANPCPLLLDSLHPFEWQPTAPSKPASYVHIVAQDALVACAQDSLGVKTPITLSAGASRSVPGSPPWQIFSAHWSRMKVYFQGQLVPPPARDISALVLSERRLP